MCSAPESARCQKSLNFSSSGRGRIIEEGLNNVIKNGVATQIEVFVHAEQEGILVEVNDTACGHSQANAILIFSIILPRLPRQVPQPTGQQRYLVQVPIWDLHFQR